MASKAFPQHSRLLKLSTGHTYNYVFIPSASSKPTLLFLHGFPSSSYDWRHQISHFSSLGYGIIAPDLLGYGGTSKPPISSISSYRGRKMVSEVVEILDHEDIPLVHGVAHDFGAFMLSRLANYAPGRLLSCSFMSVPYLKPGGHFDLDAVNVMTKQFTGYEKFGYMGFFGQLDSGIIVNQHAESFFNLFYPNDPQVWEEHMRPTGAMQAWIEKDTELPRASYITEEERIMHHEIFKEGYEEPMNWYRSAMLWNLNEDEEKEAIEKGMEVTVKVPVLLIFEPSEFVDEKEQRELCPDLKIVRTSGGGHWVQLEKRGEVNRYLEGFLSSINAQ